MMSSKNLYMNDAVFKECESDPEAKKGNNADMLAKCRAGLVDYQV